MDRLFREYVNTDDLQDSAYALVDSESLVAFRAGGDTRSHGHEEVGADGNPDLRLHGVLAGAVERLDAQVLLYPFEEQLDLPASLVDLRHDDGFDLEVVGEEDQGLSRLRIRVADSSDIAGIMILGLRPVEADGLVGAQSRSLVHRSRLPDVEAHFRLRSGHEERPGRVDSSEALEVEVPAIHRVEGSGLEDYPVQSVHVVSLLCPICRIEGNETAASRTFFSSFDPSFASLLLMAWR